tara:strand:+ start:241 stop:462 length:222 start_codon:yes stop_codon:yes gene_type:complete
MNASMMIIGCLAYIVICVICLIVFKDAFGGMFGGMFGIFDNGFGMIDWFHDNTFGGLTSKKGPFGKDGWTKGW